MNLPDKKQHISLNKFPSLFILLCT